MFKHILLPTDGSPLSLRAAKACVRFAPASSDSPYAAIIKAAMANKCNLVFMASHGRRGLKALLIGSETNKVLTHCKVPVLVYR